MDGEVCLLSSMCRKLEAEREDEGGLFFFFASAVSGCVESEKGFLGR